MRITQWGEYGVHLSVYIAHKQIESGGPVSANDIARSQSIAADYAQQILQRLRKGGIIESVRGPLGGFKLSRPAAEITLYDILVAAEGDSFEVICENHPLNNERCAPGNLCSLRELWYDLKLHVDTFLKKETLEALASRAISDGELIQIGARA